jgi:hypothetical protein
LRLRLLNTDSNHTLEFPPSQEVMEMKERMEEELGHHLDTRQELIKQKDVELKALQVFKVLYVYNACTSVQSWYSQR